MFGADFFSELRNHRNGSVAVETKKAKHALSTATPTRQTLEIVNAVFTLKTRQFSCYEMYSMSNKSPRMPWL